MPNDSKTPHARNADADFVPSSDIAVQGRGSIFTSVGEWVVLTPISDRATRLYWLLRAHVNHTRTLANGGRDERAWPTQDRLAVMLSTRRQTVAAALKELVEIGAVDVKPERYAGGLRQRNVYTVHLDPPEGFGGHRSVNELHQALKIQDAQVSESNGENVQVTPTCAPANVRACAAENRNQTKVNKTNPSESSSAARHRSADRRPPKPKEDPKKVNRRERRAWELPPVDDRAWLSLDNEALDEDIIAWVEDRYGTEAATRNMVEDMAWRDGAVPLQILNAALKREREAHGIADDEPVPGYLVNYDAWAASRPAPVVASDPWGAPPPKLVVVDDQPDPWGQPCPIDASFVDGPWAS